jgi:hypothetical protein
MASQPPAISNRIDVESFARLFDDEASLRQALVQLLVRMNREQVTPTHGAQEKGKDIIFYSPGGFGERRLFACVVKNGRITGQVDSPSGAGALIAQVEQSFDEPYIDQDGTAQYVDTVYVISPHDILPSALESVSHRLRRLGQVEFLCGAKLLDKFQHYYPSFLIEHAGYLEAYLESLYRQLMSPNALERLFRQTPGLGPVPKIPVGFYIMADCYYSLNRYSHVLSLGVLEPGVELDVESYIRDLLPIGNLIRVYSQLSENLDAETAARYHRVATGLLNFITTMRERLASGAYLGDSKGTEDKQNPQPKRFPIEAIALEDAERATLIDEARVVAKSALADVIALIAEANQLCLDDLPRSPADALADKKLVGHNRVECMSRTLPSVIRVVGADGQLTLNAQDVRCMTSSVLLTGPPGCGKTTFCRWSCWQDIRAFHCDPASAIPIYIPLHTLSDVPADYRKALFSDPLLDELLNLHSGTDHPSRRIRLYLDGLDEMPAELQQRLLDVTFMAMGQMPGLQIFVTARDHVSGAHLSRLPRLRIREADDHTLMRLASEYYGGDSHLLDDFSTQLQRVPKFKDVIRVPLLAILTVGYFRTSHNLPRTKVELYELFTKLLCGGWDLVKNVHRSCRFGEQLKRDVLTSFAYRLHKKKLREGTAEDFEEAVKYCVSGYEDIGAALLEETLIDGILLRAGVGFSFPHLSFQEYFASRALATPDMVAANDALREYMAGNDWWLDVLEFFLMGVAKPFRVDWWIAEHKGNRATSELADRIRVLYSILRTRFPDHVFAEPLGV